MSTMKGCRQSRAYLQIQLGCTYIQCMRVALLPAAFLLRTGFVVANANYRLWKAFEIDSASSFKPSQGKSGLCWCWRNRSDSGCRVTNLPETRPPSRTALYLIHCQFWTRLISAVAASSMRLYSGTEPVPVIQAARYCTPTRVFNRRPSRDRCPFGIWSKSAQMTCKTKHILRAGLLQIPLH